MIIRSPCLIKREYLLQSLHVFRLGTGAHVLGCSAAPFEAHLSGYPIVAAFVAGAVRTAPGDPVTLAMAGTLMHIGG